MIAATTEGRKRIYSLDKSKRTYTTNSTFWSTSSGYDGPSGTISFVGSPWKQEIQGGAHSSMYVMGHEIQHASDHQASGIVGDHSLKSRKNREERAVGFANYLRSVYGDGDNLRIRYDGLGLSFSGNERSCNPQAERITDFTKTHELSFGGNEVMGFSYNVSFQGEEATSSFIISLKTSSDKYVYRVFDSKKEYLEAIKRLKEQKNKEDENKK